MRYLFKYLFSYLAGLVMSFRINHWTNQRIKGWKKDCLSNDPEKVEHAKQMLRALDIPFPKGTPKD